MSTTNNTPATQPVAQSAVSVFNPLTNIEQFKMLKEAAQMYAGSKSVPDTFKGSVGDCMIAVNMAARMGTDPILIMQNMYLVHGRPAWSSMFLVGCFNSCGKFTHIEYEDNIGTEADYKKWQCRAKAIELATGKTMYGTWITWAMAEKEGWTSKPGSKWLTMPSQMFKYRAASFFIRSVAPEIALGFHTKDEINDGIVDEVAEEISVAQPSDPLKAELKRLSNEENEHIFDEEAPKAEPVKKSAKDNTDNLFNGVDIG